MTRILIIEDDPDIQKVLAYNLREGGYEVQLSRSGLDGLSLARRDKPDLVLLDLMLPDLSGIQVCRALKGEPDTGAIQVVMLSAKGEEPDRVLGLELGADDYVAKPFSVRELLLRIRAVLRRSAPPGSSGARIEFGVLGIDRGARRAWVRNAEIELTTLEFRLLCALQDRGNRVSTRDALLDEVWGMSAQVTPRTIDTHVQRLRDKLGDASQYIETVRGEGYRFADPPRGPAA